MKRRDFLRSSLGAMAGLCLLPHGCGSDSRPRPGLLRADMEASAGLRPIAVSERHLVHDVSGNRYEILALEHRILRLTDSGGLLWELGGLGIDPGQVNHPLDLVAGGDGRLYVLDHGSSEIEVYDGLGQSLFRFGSFGTALGELSFPRDLEVDAAGVIHVCDSRNHRVHLFDPDGVPLRTFGELGSGPGRFNHPEAVAIDLDGNLHVVDSGNARVQVHDPTGGALTYYGSYGPDEGQLVHPTSVAIDRQGNSYVADPVGGYVQVFGPDQGPIQRFRPVLPGGLIAEPLRLTWAPGEVLQILARPGFQGV